MEQSSYINGSDLLLLVGGKAVGHCTSHKLTFSSETKDRTVKPLASEPISSGFWKEKSVTGLSISISAEGLRFYNESESGFSEISNLWGVGQSVEVKAFKRKAAASDAEPTPYLVGKFVISSIEEDAPAGDDATYSISLENDGMPSTFPCSTENKE